MGGKRVLVVSHNRDFRSVYGAVLRFVGFEVVVTEIAADGSSATIDGRVDLIVSDFPTLASTGGSVAETLHGDPRTTHVPVLCVTSHVMALEIERAYELGAARVLPMPTTPRQLVDVVERLLAS